MAEAGLLDRSPSVRFLAQRFLADQGVDLCSRYEAALPERVVALHGLAEVAPRAEYDEVAAVIAPYLGDERVRARELAVQATGHVLGAASQSTILAMLERSDRWFALIEVSPPGRVVAWRPRCVGKGVQ
jgi:hypothetical protein